MRAKNLLFKLSLVLISLLIAIDAAAGIFDGDRKGFIAGAGIGFGLTQYSSSNEVASGTGSYPTVVYNLRIGYAPSDRLQIYYSWRQSVYIPKIAEHYENYFDNMGEGSLKGTLYLLLAPIVLPLIPVWSEQHFMPMGFGMRYYSSAHAPSLYADLGAGAMLSSLPYSDETVPKPPDNMDATFGIFGGVGWEWHKHFSLEAQFMWAHASQSKYYYFEDYSVPLTHDKYDVLSLMFTISICGY